MGTNNQFSIKTGDLLYFINDGHKYRVLGVNTDHILLCQVDTSVLNLLSYETSQIVSDLQSSRATFENDSYAMPVFDKSALPAKYRERYEEVMSVILQVLNFYKSDLTKLIGRKQKPELDAILANSSLSRVTFWRLFRQYLQSGMNPASLIDARILGANLGKTYQHVSKAGRPAKHFDTIGVILTDEVKMRFDEGIKYYKETRGARQIDAFDYMNNKYYTKTEIKNGVIVHALVSENMRPTFRQFSNYLRSSLSQQDRETAKSSAREVRNNKRVLTSDSIMDVSGPGDMVEIDACESDIYLVSSSGAIVGRPIVYFMIDVFSKIILAMGVSFDNNSYLGLTNLFLNLADNKEEYCKRFGLQYEDLRTWPSNILPNRVRMDRGSDMISNEMERLCVELNIRRDNTSGASGSLKGTVEQSFYQMEQSMKANLQKNGLIEKRYDSQHKNNASLTIYDYTRMVISYVVSHNQKMSPTYPLTKEMIDDGLLPIPALIWEYGVKKYGMPRPIPSRNQYLWSLMKEVSATISRSGIEYRGLLYWAGQDNSFVEKCYDAGTKKLPIKIRIDPRWTGSVYYTEHHRLVHAEINQKKTCNVGFENMTWAEYESYQDYRCSVAAKAKSHNEQVRVAENTIHDSIVSGSKGAVPSDMKNIRANRDIEKRRVEAEYLISERLETADLLGSTDHAIIHNASQPAALLSQDFESISTTPHRDKALLSFADFEDDF